MKKAPKRKGYAGGGTVPKTRAEHDKYYQSLGYKQIPGSTNAAYYDPSKYRYDESTKKWSALTPDASVTGWAGVNTGPKDIYAFNPTQSQIANATPGKAVVEDTMRKPVFTGNPNYQSFQYADANGQYGNATTKHFDSKTGQEIDISKSFNDKGEYIPYGLANGGVVKKLKGYANGTGKAGVDSDVVDKYSNVQNESGFKNPNQSQNPSLGAGLGLATQLGDMTGNYLAQDAINYSGTVNENEATAAGALKGASKGAQMGQAFGPWGMAIGAGLGGLGGGYMARKGAQDVNEGIDYGNRMAGYETARNEQANQFGMGLQKELQKRQEGFKNGGPIHINPAHKGDFTAWAKSHGMGVQEAASHVMANKDKYETHIIQMANFAKNAKGFAEGGEIKGKGGPKDDAIKAKVKGGSFIVPAENAEKAKAVKKMIAPKKKDNEADLDQEDGEEVKLSNGEFMFTPEEKDEIIQELGEHFLHMMAPNADHEDEGMREGGLTPYKAKKMLHEGTANGKPLTDKQRGYFGLIASGYKCGGMVKGYAGGGEVSYESPEERKYKAAVKRYAELKQEEAELSATKEKAAQSRLRDVRAERTALDKEFGFNNKVNQTNKNIPSKSGAELEKALGNGPNTTSSKVGINTKGNKFNPAGETSETQIPITKTPTQTEQEKSLVDSALKEETSIADAALKKEQATQKLAQKRNENISKGLGLGLDAIKGLGNYALPYYQYKTGKEFLAKTGPRPIDRIDPDFLNSVTTAQANAKFGMTPQEQSLLNMQNVNALRAGQEAAQNYSGGSGAVALNLSRQAGSDYYTRGLKAALADKELQMNKQQYADSLVQNKAAMNRNLFNDSMNAWQQNQTAGGQLIGAGLSNAIGAQRLNQEQQFQNQYNQNNNPWKNYNLGI